MVAIIIVTSSYLASKIECSVYFSETVNPTASGFALDPNGGFRQRTSAS